MCDDIMMVIIHLASKYVAPKKTIKVELDRLQRIVECAQLVNVQWAFENVKIKSYLEYIIAYIGPITLELCYRQLYLNMSVTEFHKKGYAVGRKNKKTI